MDRSIDTPEPFVETNVLGTLRLLQSTKEYFSSLEDESKENFRFLHVSTDEVYGSLGKKDSAFCENTPYSPNSPYSASKAGADHLVRSYNHTFGLPTLTTNCSNNYGPYQFPEKLIPFMIISALHGKPLQVYGNGLQVRDWLFVEDHARALIKVITEGKINETYNIAKGVEIARKLLVDIANSGLPAGTEFLDPISPQYVTDVISWGAIGARTAESQIHRELASGLSCPIGIKNATNGGLKAAMDGIQAATH